MSKKITLEVSPAQLNALIDIVDEALASVGAGEDDSIRLKRIHLVNKMLRKNGFK